MAELSVEDAVSIFQGCVVNHKGSPSLVTRITDEWNVKLLDLATQRNNILKFNLRDLSLPLPRLGFANIHSTAVYYKRKPVRVFKMGLDANNTAIEYMHEEAFGEGVRVVQDRAKRFDTVEFFDMLVGNYPDFKAAMRIVKEFGGACAFDKQFAIDFDMNIFYRTKRVGRIPKNCSTIDRIEWERGYEFLINLIGTNYEKTVRSPSDR